MAETRDPKQGAQGAAQGAQPQGGGGKDKSKAQVPARRAETQPPAGKTDTPAAVISRVLDSARKEVIKALPKTVSAEHFLRVAVTAITKNPYLLQCDPVSIGGAVLEAAQLNLQLDGITGHAYLLPFKDNRSNRWLATMVPGYRGYILLAHRSGRVASVHSDVVCQADQFRYQKGLHDVLDHIPATGTMGDTADKPGTRGGWLGAYCVIHMLGGGRPTWDYLQAEDILRIKARSPSVRQDRFSPWKTDEEWMWRKTVIRQVCKVAPLSAELQRLAVRDEYLDAGVNLDFAGADGSVDVAAFRSAARADDLRDRYRTGEAGKEDASKAGAGGAGAERVEDQRPLTAEEEAALDRQLAKEQEDERAREGKGKGQEGLALGAGREPGSEG